MHGAQPFRGLGGSRLRVEEHLKTFYRVLVLNTRLVLGLLYCWSWLCLQHLQQGRDAWSLLQHIGCPRAEQISQHLCTHPAFLQAVQGLRVHAKHENTSRLASSAPAFPAFFLEGMASDTESLR